MVNASIYIAWQSMICKDHAIQLAERLALPLLEQPGLPNAGSPAIQTTQTTDLLYPLFLYVSETKLELIMQHQSRFSHFVVDFLSGHLDYRRRFGGGKNQAIARAIGLKTYSGPLQVLDITAGFGKDAFILATLGCQVKMIERSLVMGALLEDGLVRAAQSEKKAIQTAISAMQLKVMDAKAYLKSLEKAVFPEVIYIDPMFPESRKTALNKIEMRMLRATVGEDIDADELLPLALSKATRRVVVKRPAEANVLANLAPTFVVKGKSNRYDVYIIQ